MKSATTITLDSDLLFLAREQNLNLSKTVNDYLKTLLKTNEVKISSKELIQEKIDRKVAELEKMKKKQAKIEAAEQKKLEEEGVVLFDSNENEAII